MKKLLLVAVSVGFFLIVTVTVALALTTTGVQRQEASISSSAPYSQGRVQPVENAVRNTNEQPVIINITETPVIIEEEIPVIADRHNGDSLTIQIPLPNTTEVSRSTVNNQPAAVVRQPAPVVTPAAVPSVQNTVITGAYSAASSSAATSTARTSPVRTINDYWIQTGAYSAMVRAEDARELLATKGLISIIENRDVNGQNLYRVRLGPYTSEREANHWLAIVQAIDGFDDSQVRQTVRQQ